LCPGSSSARYSHPRPQNVPFLSVIFFRLFPSKDFYLILDTLPCEYDSRVKAMEEVDTRPNEQYSDIGGMDKQIQELIEAVVLPMTHKER
jgi:ATP-dependent 26S proteasome regulatory subunit